MFVILMTNKVKTIPFVFAFAAMMLAWPLTAQEVNADGEIVIPGICGVTISGNFALPALTAGTTGTESSVFTITTDGNTAGTFEIVASDWIGNGETATGAITLVSVAEADTITINSIVYTAEDDGVTTAENLFDVATTDNVAATSLAAQINADTRAVNVQATARENVVLLRTDAIGAAADNTPLAESTSSARVTLSGATMVNGEAQGTKHMESTATRYSVTNTGVDPASNSYTDKGTAGTTFPTTETDKKVVITQTESAQDIKMLFQVDGTAFTGADTYSGGLTQTLTFTTLCN